MEKFLHRSERIAAYCSVKAEWAGISMDWKLLIPERFYPGGLMRSIPGMKTA
jgi:hypothetical protein